MDNRTEGRSAVPAWQLWLVALTLALTFLATLEYHRELIAFPFPLDSAEPAESFIARGIASGVDMRDIANQPMYSEGYGTAYLAITSGLCRWGIACDLPGQRLLCGLFIAGMLVLVALICRRLGVPWMETCCAALWAYEVLLLNVTPISRPGALGDLLWLAGLAAPFLLDYSAASILLAALLLSLATFSKLYFLCGAGFLGAWLLLRHRERLALFAGGMAVFLAALTVLSLRWLPYLFYGSLLVHFNSSPKSSAYMVWQLKGMLLHHSPGLAVAALAALLPAARRPGREGGEWALYGALGMLLFVGLMGGDRGGRYTYFTQLVALPFIPYAAAVFHRVARPRPAGLVLLLACAAWAAHATVRPDFSRDGTAMHEWMRTDALIGAARHPFADADLDCSLQARGLPVRSTGMCTWFSQATQARGPLADLFPLAGAMAERYRAWIASGRAAVADPSTDLVMVPSYSPLYFPDLLKTSYLHLGTVWAPYSQTGGMAVLEVYVRPDRAAAFGFRPPPAPRAVRTP